MATKRKPPVDDEFLEEPSQSEMDIEDFLLEWAPQTSVVEIYRRRDDGSLPHIKRVEMNILRADLYGYLRDKFGNGKYVLQFKNQARRIVKTLTIDVEGAAVMAPGVPSSGGNTFLEQLLLTMIANNRPAPPPPPLDMGALLAGLGAMIGALKPSASDPAAMLAAMAQTFQQLKPPEDNVDKALSIISKAKELVPGGEGHDDSWPGLIKDVGRTVVEVLRPSTNGHNPPRETLPAVPPGAVLYQPPIADASRQVGPEGINAQSSKSPEDILKEWIGAQLSFLKTKARAGKDPEFWVEYVLENAEEPGNAAILEAMRRGATFQHLLTFDPEIGKDPVLSGWFQRFYEELHAAFNENVDTGGPGGDTPDPGGDAEPC